MGTNIEALKAQLRKEVMAEIKEAQEAEQALKDKPEFTVCIYHPIEAVTGRILSIKRYKELDMYYNDGWYDTPAKFLSTTGSVLGQVIREVTAKKKEEPKEAEKKDEPLLPSTIAAMVVKLLKGHTVAGKTGLSLTSFRAVYMAADRDNPAVEKETLRPLYNKVMEQYNGKVYKKGNSWYLKDK
jgi:hypothetical protein